LMPSSSITATAKGSIGRGRTPTESTKIRRACSCRSIAAAIGERIALWLQANSTLPGRRMPASAPDVPHAQQGEEPRRGIEVDLDLVRELLSEQLGALVVKAAAAHVDRLDPRWARRADRGVVALADQEVVAHDAAEGLQCHGEPVELPTVGGADLHHEP